MKKIRCYLFFAVILIACTSGCYAMNISTNDADAKPLGDIPVTEKMFTASRLMEFFLDPGEIRLDGQSIQSWSALTDYLDTSGLIPVWTNQYILEGDAVFTDEHPNENGLFLVENADYDEVELHAKNSLHLTGDNSIVIETLANDEENFISIGNETNLSPIYVNAITTSVFGDVEIKSVLEGEDSTLGNARLTLNGDGITKWSDIVQNYASKTWAETNFVHLDGIYSVEEDSEIWQIINWLYVYDGLRVNGDSGITLDDETINSWGDLTNDVATIAWVEEYVDDLNIGTNYLELAGGTVTGDAIFESNLTVDGDLMVNYVSSSDVIAAKKFRPILPSVNTSLDDITGMYIYKYDQAETTTNLVVNGHAGASVIINAGDTASIRVGPESDDSLTGKIEITSDNTIFNGLVSVKDSMEVGPNCYAPSSGAAIGNGNTANSLGAVAIGGEGNRALEKNSIAMGYCADALHTNSFIWNGSAPYTVESKGEGTFTIVPKDGLEGFYVGNTNLETILTDYITTATQNTVDKTGDTMTGNLTVPEIKSTIIRNGTSALHGNGENTIANGDYLFTEGNNSFASGKGTYTTTQYKISGSANATTYSVSGTSSYFIEIGSTVRISTNVAEVISFDGTSLVVDKTLSPSALNNATLIVCDGVSYGEDSFVSGYGNISSGTYSSSIGRKNLASREGTFALGQFSRATNDYSYVWNSTTTNYGSHGSGTYNIKPSDGMAGFFVGETNMETFVNAKVKSYSPDHRARIVTTSSSSVQTNDYLVWMDTETAQTDQTFMLSGMDDVDFMTVVIRKLGDSTTGTVTITDDSTTKTLTDSGDTIIADWVGAKYSWYFRP